MPAKVKIDQDACTACGLCYNDECPDVFEEGAEGKSCVKPAYKKGSECEGEVPDDKKACAAAAADACPVSAITVG
ncbi:MAG TPA: ferredoxin [Methanomassiliicoccales archaeon]|nr:ferredoxin [Methanomassiliicoccales archaeon]HXZ23602.1 ferredoxin [Methanomassiliicoccales archaeon]